MGVRDSREKSRDTLKLASTKMFTKQTDRSLVERVQIIEINFVGHSIVNPDEGFEIRSGDFDPAGAVGIKTAANPQRLQFGSKNIQTLKLKASLEAKILKNGAVNAQMLELEAALQMEFLENGKRGLGEEVQERGAVVEDHEGEGEGMQRSEATAHDGGGRQAEARVDGAEGEDPEGIAGDDAAWEVEVIVGGDLDVEFLDLVADGGAEEAVEAGETQSGGEAEESDVGMLVVAGVENAGDDVGGVGIGIGIENIGFWI